MTSRAKFQLRTYVYLDRMQPQFAAFMGTVTQGDLPITGMAALYVEMAPSNEVFRMVDVAVKVTEVRPGAQIVEREFGMLEIHSMAQSAVQVAGQAILDRIGCRETDRVRPQVTSVQTITNVDPYQAQLLNRHRKGSMLIPGQTLFVLEAAPAAYITYAANEAEKATTVNLIHITSVGRFGRLYLSGTEADMMAAKRAALQALDSLEGKE
ncbi:MAG: hypothetical protein GXP41_12010 [Chloroflexi bacterium]|nr:hypothetical protein [Chloroflexota bacterium]